VSKQFTVTVTQCQFSLSKYVRADRITAFPCEMWFRISLLICYAGKISGVLYPIRNNYKEVVRFTPPEDEVTFHLYHRWVYFFNFPNTFFSSRAFPVESIIRRFWTDKMMNETLMRHEILVIYLHKMYYAPQ
jgi:hypothetical protein